MATSCGDLPATEAKGSQPVNDDATQNVPEVVSQAMDISEIISLVCEALGKDKKMLLNCALVNKRWENEAIRVLWRIVLSGDKLHIIPEYKIPNLKDLAAIATVSGIERMHRYSRNVRRIVPSTRSPCPWTPRSMTSTYCNARRVHGVFDASTFCRLQEAAFRAGKFNLGSDLALGLSPYLQKGLQGLEIHYNGGGTIGFFRRLEFSCPNLKYFDLRLETNKLKVNLICDAIERYLNNARLHTFLFAGSDEFVSRGIINAIARMRSLQTLRLGDEFIALQDHLVPAHETVNNAFENLASLDIAATRNVLRVLPTCLPKLRNLSLSDVEVGPWFSFDTQFRDVETLRITQCHNRHFLIFKGVYTSYSDDVKARFQTEILQMMEQFPNLVRLYLHHTCPGDAYDVSFAEELMVNFPSLQQVIMCRIGQSEKVEIER